MSIWRFDDSSDSNKLRLMFSVITAIVSVVLAVMVATTDDVQEQRTPLLVFSAVVFSLAVLFGFIAWRKVRAAGDER